MVQEDPTGDAPTAQRVAETDAFLALDGEIAAACRQLTAAGDALVDGGLRLGRALLMMADTRAWEGRGYASFEAYCQQRHGLALRTAQRYMRAAAALPATAALDGVPAWQVTYLAEVYRIDPEVVQQWLAAPNGAARERWSRDAWDQRLATLRAENERLHAELSAAIERADQSSAMNRMLSERLNRVQQLVQESGAQSASARQEADRLRGHNRKLTEEVESLRRALDQAQRALAERPPPVAGGAGRRAPASPPPAPAVAPLDHGMPPMDGHAAMVLSIILTGMAMLERMAPSGAGSDGVIPSVVQSWVKTHPGGRSALLTLTAWVLDLDPHTSDDQRLVAQALRTLVMRMGGSA
jgi:CheY-like chemotaxis protein